MGFRDWARREIRKSEAQRYARDLAALAEAKRSTTARGKADLDAQRAACGQTVDSVRARADQTFQQDVRKARERRAATVQPAKECCATEAAQIKHITRGQKEQLDQRARELRNERDMLKRAERGPGRAKTSAKERRSESDDEVLANVEPELHALFNRVKKTIKGSERRSRTEEFLHYVEEHPSEAMQARADAADAWLSKELKKSAKTQGARTRSKASGDDVPF